MKMLFRSFAACACALTLGLLLGSAALPASAAVVVQTRVPVLWDVTFYPAPCKPPSDGAGCSKPYEAMTGAFGLSSSLSGIALSIDLGEIDGESSSKDHKGEVELRLGETLRFSFEGQWTSPPPGGPVPIPYPNIFAFAAGVDEAGLTPPDGGAPLIDIGRIESRDFAPIESAGRLLAFDEVGGVTEVGTWASRLLPATVPEPGTMALLVVGIAGVLASRRSALRAGGRTN